MDYPSFKGVVDEVRSEKEGEEDDDFKLFELRTASSQEVRRAEHELNVELPIDYRRFMEEYGGGRFLFVELFPLISSEEGEASVISESIGGNPLRFIAIASVGTGDYWGFPVKANRCLDRVVMASHDDGALLDDDSGSFLEFAMVHGLRLALP